jgi:alkylated DNA repair dioxygenase AlkB
VVATQLALFGKEPVTFDASFAQLRRVELADGAWLDVLPGWLLGHETVFEHLRVTTRFRLEQRKMYDRVLDVPRLYAVLPDDGPGHPVLPALRAALSARYDQDFERCSLALYRSGRDSVAWHGDRIARRMPSALVATVSVGAPRKFLLRPYGGGTSMAFSLGWGDLLVMGGSCQRSFQHCVPKTAHAEPRLSIMFRPRWPEPSDTSDED